MVNITKFNSNQKQKDQKYNENIRMDEKHSNYFQNIKNCAPQNISKAVAYRYAQGKQRKKHKDCDRNDYKNAVSDDVDNMGIKNHYLGIMFLPH